MSVTYKEPEGRASDLLWTFNCRSPRKLFVEYDESRKFDFVANRHKIEETRRDTRYIWYRWKVGMFPGEATEAKETAKTEIMTEIMKDFAKARASLGSFSEEDFGKISMPPLKPTLPIVKVPMVFDLEGKVAKFEPLKATKVKESAITSHPPRTKAPRKWPEQLNTCIDAGLKRILLVGPPGTGKTTAAATGFKFSVTCHEAMGPESMIGMFILKAGQTEWVDGPATQAMKLGTRLILNEIDRTSGECTSLLYALMDDKPAIMLPTGEYVEALEGYSVIGTSNGNPNDMSDAILDRIEAVLIADEPHIGAVNAIATAAPEDIATKIVSNLNNYYRSVSKTGWNWSGKATVRRMFSFSRLLKHGVTDTVAAQLVFGDSGKEILSCLATAAK